MSKSIIENYKKAIEFGEYITKETSTTYLTESKKIISVNNIISKSNKLVQYLTRAKRDVEKIKAIVIDVQQLKDFEEVLNLMYPRNLIGSLNIVEYFISNYNNDDKLSKFNLSDIGRSTFEKRNYETSFDIEIENTIKDLDDCVKAYTNSSSYKRLSKEYPRKKTENISMDIIINDLDDCKNNIEKINDLAESLNDIDSKNQDKSKIYQKYYTLIIRFLERLLQYYNDRIKVLNMFMSVTKRYVITDTIKYKVSTKSVNYDRTVDEDTYWIDLSYSDYDLLVKLIKNLDKFSEKHDVIKYKDAFEKATELLDIELSSVFNVNLDWIDDNKENKTKGVNITILREQYKEIRIAGKTIYHTSSRPHLKEINFSLSNSTPKLYFPEPRIYVHISVPSNRFGSRILSQDEYVYELENKFSIAYLDLDLLQSAAFIVTDKPIKVRREVPGSEYYRNFKER